MDRATALDALTKAAVDVLSVTADQVTEQASFADDLDADSLDLVELVMQLEDSLDVTIDEDDLGEVRTVGDAVDLILAASAANARRPRSTTGAAPGSPSPAWGSSAPPG